MAQMQEAMKNPEVQKEMQQAQQAMANPELQKRMAELKDDPEFKDMFKEIETGGMPALMKYMNDPTVLSKLGKKLEGVQMNQGPPPNAEPVINDLFDAARHASLNRCRKEQQVEQCACSDISAGLVFCFSHHINPIPLVSSYKRGVTKGQRSLCTGAQCATQHVLH